MKALTVRQPWAWAIAAGFKTVENRTRGTSYRGPLAIHAGARVSERGLGSPVLLADADALPWRDAATNALLLGREWPASQLGAVVAVAELVDSHDAVVGRLSGESMCCDDPYAETVVYRDDKRDPTRGVVHLVLADVVVLDEPVPCRGMLGFWTVPGDVTDAIEAELAVLA